MAPFYQKPENALKRAEELVAVSQNSSALSLLHEIIISKRARSTPLATLEPIVVKFLELCVLLARGKMAREGLFAYKNIAQNTNIASIELVIKKFLDYAKASLDAAQKKAKQINLALIDDLEAAETPESIMMSMVSSEDSKDRTDRQVVTPWLRFLWEAYRSALDTLRNNSKLEGLYQIVANEAFAFCLKFDRKVEFRRLCETIRQHLASAVKYNNQMFSIDLNDPITLQRHLDTRFSQVNAAAADMELWQEGFRSVEDIWNLIRISKKTPKPYMMANYYDKLSRILMKGENYLFHAASFEKSMNIQKLNPNLTQEDRNKSASQFLISVLAIPIINNQNVDDEKNKMSRLTALLHESEVPSREKLLQRALSKSVFSMVSAEVKELYKLLEVQFHPLSICQNVAPIIKSFSENEQFSKYVKPLHHIILTRLLQQLSQVYSSIKIDAVVKLAAFPSPFNYDARYIENFVVNGCRTGEFSIRINHQTKSLLFEPSVFTHTSEKHSHVKLHSLPADNMRLQLSQFSSRLQAAVALIDPEYKKQKEQARSDAFKLAAVNTKTDRENIFYRRVLIQRKQERREEEEAEKEKLRQQRLVEEQLAEKARLDEKEKEMAQERMLQQRKEIERAEAQKLAEKIAGELREKNVKIKDDEIMDTEKLIELQVQQLDKERRELAQKTKSLAKRIDHTERAFRREEIKYLEEDYEAQQAVEKEAHEAKTKSMIESSKTQYERNLAYKKRVARMIDDYTFFRSKLVQERDEKYALLIREAEEKIEAEKDKRIKEFEEKKKEAARKAEEAKKAAEKEAAAKKAREAERKAKEAEDLERQKKLDEIAQLQRQKDLEIEEKLARSAGADKPQAYRPPGAAGSSSRPGWRDRVAAKEAFGSSPEPAMSRSSSSGGSSAFASRPAPASGQAWGRSGDKPSAFSSIKPKTDAAPNGSSAETPSGPPKIGSGKWSSARRNGGN